MVSPECLIPVISLISGLAASSATLSRISSTLTLARIMLELLE